MPCKIFVIQNRRVVISVARGGWKYLLRVRHREAMCLGFVIYTTRSGYDNLPLLAHELTHVRQIIRSGGVVPHVKRLAKHKVFRLACEVEAYQAQVAQQVALVGATTMYANTLNPPGGLISAHEYWTRWFAKILATCYRGCPYWFRLTAEQAEALLRDTKPPAD